MGTAAMVSERTRDMLHRTILQALRSWPDTDRVVFCQVHYRGRSPEEVAERLGYEPQQVHRILRSCEARLRASLREFRARTVESPACEAEENLEAVSY